MTIGPKFVEVTADVFGGFYFQKFGVRTGRSSVIPLVLMRARATERPTENRQGHWMCWFSGHGKNGSSVASEPMQGTRRREARPN